MPLIAIAAIVVSCQNQQSSSQTNDSLMNGDSSAHAMSTTKSNMADSSIMFSMNQMMENMHKMEKSGNADHDLAASLQEHHKGAVDMAEAEPMFKSMATKMIADQTKEIQEFENWQAGHK